VLYSWLVLDLAEQLNDLRGPLGITCLGDVLCEWVCLLEEAHYYPGKLTGVYNNIPHLEGTVSLDLILISSAHLTVKGSYRLH
jgi:hypothetical protein